MFYGYVSLVTNSGITKPFSDGNRYITGTLKKHQSWIFDVLSVFFGEESACTVCNWIYGEPKSKAFIDGYGLFKVTPPESNIDEIQLQNSTLPQL